MDAGAPTSSTPNPSIPSPGSDATYDFKYGIRAVAGGGRSSARETIGRVAAGAVAKKLLKTLAGTEAWPLALASLHSDCREEERLFTDPERPR